MTDRHTAKARVKRWEAVGLVIVGVAAIAVTLFRELLPRNIPDFRPILASLSPSDSSVDFVLIKPTWTETRGDGEGTLASDARAVRLGAAIVELEVQSTRGNNVRAQVSRVVQLLRTFPGSDNAVRAFELPESPLDKVLLGSAREAAERVAGKRPLQLGSWLQAARFAAAIRDSLPFSGDDVQAVFREVIATDARPETEHTVRQFAEISRARPHDFVALGTAAEELLRLLGAR